jgi:hypothetical protein
MKVRTVAGITLLIGVVALIGAPLAAQRHDRGEFEAKVLYTAIPARGSISCPGGGAPLPSLMPPWCPGSRTAVRQRTLTGAVVETTDPRLSGTAALVMNMNLDESFEGPIWGTYAIDVPGRGTWEGTFEGKWEGPTLASYRLIAHGSGEFEDLELRASLVWQAGKGESWNGFVVEPRGCNPPGHPHSR